MKENEKGVRLEIKNIAFDKFMENRAIRFLLDMAYAFSKEAMDKETSQLTESDVLKLRWMVDVVAAFETLSDDVDRLYAENAALSHTLGKIDGKEHKIVFKHIDLHRDKD